MQGGTNIIEIAAAVGGDGLPEDYCVARELALAGSNKQAERIYGRLLAEATSRNLQALVYNDLAALAATAGDTQASHGLLQHALDINPHCEAALENWSAVFAEETSRRRGQAHYCSADFAKMTQFPIYGFMHVGLINHWREIVKEQLLKLHASGLWDRTERIFVGLVGPRHEEFDFDDEKLEVVHRSADFEEAEYPTLKALQQFCSDHDCVVFYMHTKGNFHVSENTRDWRHLMEYFVIEQHEECLGALVDHDACGVNLLIEPSSRGFFAGNFWWAKSAYIQTLPPLGSLGRSGPESRPDRYTCERWIGMCRGARLATLHQCPVDQYHCRYPRKRYERRAEG